MSSGRPARRTGVILAKWSSDAVNRGQPPARSDRGPGAVCARKLAALRDVGATAVTCSVSATSAGHYCDQLVALRDLADDLGS